MSQAVEYARTARQSLAAALMAIQTSPEIPDGLMAVADVIAETMGILHRIERSGGADLTGRDSAITNVRSALSSLQQLSPPHPAVDATMDSVAASLSNLHALSKLGAPAQPPAPQWGPPAQPQPQPQAPPAPQWGPPAQQPAQQQPQTTYGSPRPAQQQPQPTYQPPQPAPQQPQTTYGSPRPAQQQPQTTYGSPRPAQQQPQPTYQPPQPAPQQPQPTYQPPQPAPQQPQPQPVFRQSPGRASVDVELGTSSASNFYKGLAGNDVVEHGGIFVATYKIRAIGEAVELRVLMPGNYEFYASGVVQWIREPGEGQSEPGFGARFTQITPEGRQLVYRYARNREPLFFDDL